MLGPQFSYIAPKRSDDEHHITTHIKDSFGSMFMGNLSWNQQGGITNIYVPKHSRRKKIATKMYKFAQEGVKSGSIDSYTPEHSAARTYEGEMWAGSVDPEHERPDWITLDES